MQGTGQSKVAVQLVAAAILLGAGLVPAASALDVSTKAIKVVASHEYKDSNLQSYAGELFTGQLDATGEAIAVLDTGVDDGHPTFQNAFVAGAKYDTKCGCMQDETATGDTINPDDQNGHGTHVASIALGRGGDGGPRGVASGAKLVDVKIASDFTGISTNGIETGIDWVIDYNEGNTPYPGNPDVSVIVLSFGGTEPWTDRERNDAMKAVQRATQKGILVVAAAGNCGPGAGNVSTSCPSGGKKKNGIVSPGAAPEALTVGAIDDNHTIRRNEHQVADYSSRGPNPGGNASDEKWRKPDVVAPGSNVTAACYNLAGQNSQGMDCTKNGTSMAAPHVGGVAAILWQALERVTDEQPTPAKVKSLITSTAEDLGEDGWDIESGYGYVDAYRAVVKATNEPPVSQYDYWPSNPETGQQVTFNSSSYDPDEDRIERLVWSVDGETIERSADQPRLLWTFDEPGKHSVNLTAVDEHGTPDPQPFRRTIHVSEPEPEEDEVETQAPQVEVAFGPTPVYTTQRTWFDASNSTDPDGHELVSFAWDFDADDSFDPDRETDAPRTNWTFDDAGPRSVTVEVTDGSGASARGTVSFEVREPPQDPPAIQITNPQDGDILEPGTTNVTWFVSQGTAESFGMTVDGVKIDDTANRFLEVQLDEGNHTIAVKANGPGGSDVDRVNVTVVESQSLEQTSRDDGDENDTGAGTQDEAQPSPSRPSTTDGESGPEGAQGGTGPSAAPNEAPNGTTQTENEAPGPGVALVLAAVLVSTVARVRAGR